MTAVALALIDAVTAAGGAIAFDGQDLQLEAPVPLSEFLLASLRQHKPLLVAFLAEQAANTNRPPEAAPTTALVQAVPAAEATAVPAAAPVIPTPLLAVEPGPWSTGIPDPIARGLGTLFGAPIARGILDHHWWTVVNDTLAFVDHGQAAQAFALGWSAADLFGCDAQAPWHRLDRAGLMLLVQGREVSELTTAHAGLKHRDGSVLRFRRVLTPPRPPVAMLWHLLPKRLRPAVGPAP